MTQLILLIVALSTHGRSHEIAYEVCDTFIEDAVRYSEMDTMHLTALRSQVMAAKDLAFLKGCFRRHQTNCSEPILPIASNRLVKWLFAIHGSGSCCYWISALKCMEDPLASCGAPIIWLAERHCCNTTTI